MRRVLAFLEWHVGWWENQQMLHEGLASELAQGMIAYARKQAGIQQTIRTSFNRLWHSSDELIALGVRSNNDVLDLQEAATRNILDMPTLT